MDVKLRKKVTAYLISKSVIERLYKENVISKEEYLRIDKKLTNKYDISSYSIFVDTNLYIR